MIINIRGTSGSGKSTIVRSLVETLKPCVRVKTLDLPKRKQPTSYMLGSPPVAVLGHYETACGGCDTLPGYDHIFSEVRCGADMCQHVVFEGLLVSEEVRRTIELHQAFPDQLRVIFLDTPIEVCLESIRARRLARGDERPLKEDNTRNRVETIRRSCQKLKNAGVQVWTTESRDAAADWVREWLS